MTNSQPSLALSLRQWTNRLKGLVFARYLIASVIALAIDMGSFLGLLRLSVDPTVASVSSYCLGILVHWLLSSRAVFVGHVAAEGRPRMRQKLLFIGSALVGVAVTAMIVATGDWAGQDPRLSKLEAVGISFLLTWLLRRNVVFKTP